MVLKSHDAPNVARDVSWHPSYPVIASTSFDSGEINTWTIQNKEQEELPKLTEVDPRDHFMRLFRGASY